MNNGYLPAMWKCYFILSLKGNNSKCCICEGLFPFSNGDKMFQFFFSDSIPWVQLQNGGRPFFSLFFLCILQSDGPPLGSLQVPAQGLSTRNFVTVDNSIGRVWGINAKFHSHLKNAVRFYSRIMQNMQGSEQSCIALGTVAWAIIITG